MARLAGLLDDFVGNSALDRSLSRQLPSIIERVDGLALSLDRISADMQEAITTERREREKLVRDVSTGHLQQPADEGPECHLRVSTPPLPRCMAPSPSCP